MTDITDQDRRAARKWAENWRGDIDNDTSAAARVILATVDAPAPTLAEELREFGETPATERDMGTFGDIADRVEQVEQERDQAKKIAELNLNTAAEMKIQRDNLRAEVERLTAERVTDPSPTLNDGSMTRPATVAREENVYPDLPDPADVKPGEAWEVVATDPAKSFGGTNSYNSVAFRTADRWVVHRQFHQTPLVVPDDCVRLIRRLVPAPRVITNPDELEEQFHGTIIRDGGGDMYQKILHGWYRSGSEQVHRYDDNVIILPVTVLWGPEA